jgi:hypothetical protein
MPRTKGSQHIRGYREHGLIRDLAANDLSAEELAARYGIEPDTVYHFKERNKDRVAQVLADWSDEFSDLWSVKKHNRIADLQYLAGTIQERMDELTEDAETATEVMRNLNPDAAPVRVPLREWQSLVQEKAKLHHQIAEEMGQLPTRIAVETQAAPLTFGEVLIEDEHGQLHPVRQ